MNYETATNDDLEVKLGELLGMGRFAALTAPRYCTDWNATMPLAVEYHVSFDSVFDMSRDCGESMATSEFMAHATDLVDGCFYPDSEFFEGRDDNPLRAIVICLIKVLESKQ